MTRVWAAIDREASTRSVSLLRILTVFVLWSKWGVTQIAPNSLVWEDLVLAFFFWAVSFWMLLGIGARLAAAAMAVVVGVLVYGVGENSHHTRILVLTCGLLALTPCGGSWSLRRWLQVREARRIGRAPPPEVGPDWGRWGLILMVGAVYFWSGVDKMNPSFLTGQQLEMQHMYFYFGSDYPAAPGWHLFEMVSAWGITALWITFPVLLVWRRTQWWALPLGMFLHAVIYLTLPVVTFTASMWSLYLVFLDPDVFHVWIDEIMGHGSGA